MARIVRITPSKPFAPGKMQFDLDLLPAGYRIDSVTAELTGALNVPAAGLTSAQQTRLLSAVEQDRRIRSDGLGLDALDWLVKGRDMMRPADIAVNAAAPVALVWPIELRDPRAIEPKDTSVPTEFYKNQTLNLYWANPTDILAALAVNAGTSVQLVFQLSERAPGVVPASTVIGYVEVIGKETKLPAGRIVDLVLVKNDASAITEAELGNMHLTLDGKHHLLERARLPQLVRDFNRYVAGGAQVQGATDGVEGEALAENAVPFAPIWHPETGYKATQLDGADEVATFVYDGTLAGNVARLYYRMREEQDEVATAKAAQKLGIPVNASTVFEGKTASKNGLPPGASFKRAAGVMARRIRSA
jgi:hypothetical protein